VLSAYTHREATFTEEQRAGYYKQMPPMMHHFPHMFFLQQRQQQQMAQHNQQRMYREQMEARMAMDKGAAGAGKAGATGGSEAAPSSSAGGEGMCPFVHVLSSAGGNIVACDFKFHFDPQRTLNPVAIAEREVSTSELLSC
jgi:hypothetical protein